MYNTRTPGRSQIANEIRTFAGKLAAVDVTIRPGRCDDIEALRDIERRAGARFRDVGLGHVADAEPFSAEELTDFIVAGRAWTALDGNGALCGYAVATVVDGNGHLEQI